MVSVADIHELCRVICGNKVRVTSKRDSVVRSRKGDS